MPDNPIEIIQLSPDEWQAYRDLRLEALQDSPQAFGSSYQGQLDKPEEHWRNRLAEAAKCEDNWLLFARAGGRVVGMIGAFRSDAHDSSVTDEAMIVAVYVTPAWRGRGVSGLLMSAILDLLKKSGLRLAFLGVNVEQVAAVKLYQRFGFRITCTGPELLGDGLYHDEHEMVKTL